MDKDSSIGVDKPRLYAQTDSFSLGTIDVELSAANKTPETSSDRDYQLKMEDTVVTLVLSPVAIRRLAAWIAIQLLPTETPNQASTSGTTET